METRRPLYCLWVVVECFYYCMGIFIRRSMLVNFLNCDCLSSSLIEGKDTFHHPEPEGEHIAASEGWGDWWPPVNFFCSVCVGKDWTHNIYFPRLELNTLQYPGILWENPSQFLLKRGHIAALV